MVFLFLGRIVKRRLFIFVVLNISFCVFYSYDSVADISVVLYKDGDKYYIALGDDEAIHLYKYTFNQSQNYITQIIIQTTIFKLIKKIKKNSGLF
jgi:hypothetical protein